MHSGETVSGSRRPKATGEPSEEACPYSSSLSSPVPPGLPLFPLINAAEPAAALVRGRRILSLLGTRKLGFEWPHDKDDRTRWRRRAKEGRGGVAEPRGGYTVLEPRGCHERGPLEGQGWYDSSDFLISYLVGGHWGLRAVPIGSHEIFRSLQFVVYLVLYYYGPLLLY